MDLTGTLTAIQNIKAFDKNSILRLVYLRSVTGEEVCITGMFKGLAAKAEFKDLKGTTSINLPNILSTRKIWSLLLLLDQLPENEKIELLYATKSNVRFILMVTETHAIRHMYVLVDEQELIILSEYRKRKYTAIKNAVKAITFLAFKEKKITSTSIEQTINKWSIK